MDNIQICSTALNDIISYLTKEQNLKDFDDFHNLDKSAIFTVVTAAVQDMDRIIQAQQASLTQAQAQIASLQQQMAAVLAKLGM